MTHSNLPLGGGAQASNLNEATRVIHTSLSWCNKSWVSTVPTSYIWCWDHCSTRTSDIKYLLESISYNFEMFYLLVT